MPLQPSLSSLRTALELVLSLAFFAVTASSQTPEGSSYFEFGTVVAIARGSIDIQTFDPQRQKMVQHTFLLTRQTRADIVHVSDAVEAVFTTGAGGWELRRMIVLNDGIPLAGVPAPHPQAGALSLPLPTQTVVPAYASAALPALPKTKAVRAPARAALPSPRPTVKTPVTAAPVPSPALAASTKGKPAPAVVAVELGSPAEAAARVAARKTRDVAIAAPSEECNRSSQDWPTQPLHIAVLDFRYPTEREEAHDIGTTGGGSGTAVADLVFSRLEQDAQSDDQYAWSRADRRRLDRSDFAGAARLGRQLGADAVLAGTFVPVETPATTGDEPLPPKAYQLRAGIVDTCTGQLLLQVGSVTCGNGVEPGVQTGADPAACKHLSVTTTDTSDPKAHAQAFRPAFDAMLFPVEHEGRSPGKPGSAGVVAAIDGNRIVVDLLPQSPVKPGQQIAVLASRLAKNSSTYTLRRLQSEEIGRVQVVSVHGLTATGNFVGDYAPRLGDAVDTISP